MAALIWTPISGLGLVVALGVLLDTLRHYIRFRRERPELAPAYTVEVVQDVAIAAVQAAFLILGVLAALNVSQNDPHVRAFLFWLLFAGPVLLTLASLNHYWSRRRL